MLVKVSDDLCFGCKIVWSPSVVQNEFGCVEGGPTESLHVDILYFGPKDLQMVRVAYFVWPMLWRIFRRMFLNVSPKPHNSWSGWEANTLPIQIYLGTHRYVV